MRQMTTLLTRDSVASLATVDHGPCLSLYQPTHRRHPENQQDPIRFRNLVKELEASLLRKHPAAEAQLLLEPFEALAHDRDFWAHTLDGLAVLGGAGLFHAYRFPQPVAELAVVADSFHTKPLWRFLQSIDGYQVLGLNLQAIRLFEGNRRGLAEVDLAPGVPRTIAEALGGELTEPHQTVASYGGIGGSSVPMRHGQGGKKDEVDIDSERFFRAVDRAVLEHYSRPSGLPLILAALPQHHHLFHRVSQNPFLLTEGIRFDPDALTAAELQSQAWQTMEPQYRARLAALGEEFQEARSKGTGSDDLAQVVQASTAGRVATLLIEADRVVAGRIDEASGQFESADLGDPGVDDVLDDLGELVTRMGGRAVVIPAERMPTQTGLAAIYRY
jgi:hypothetical protein